MAHCRVWIALGIHPHSFDVNLRAIEGPLVRITITARDERAGINVQMIRRKYVRCWERLPSSAYPSKFA